MYIPVQNKASLIVTPLSLDHNSLVSKQSHNPQQRPLDLVALAAETAGQLDVLGLDRDALGVDGAQVGVLEE